MIRVMFTETFDAVVTKYYREKGRDRRWAEDRLMDALDVIRDGNVRGTLSAPEFPYGAAIMLTAKETEKLHVLVSDIHSHHGNLTSPGSASDAIDAMVLLLPLIAKGIITIGNAHFDGGDYYGKYCQTYLGSDRIRKLAGDVKPGKTSSVPWTEAIRLLLT